jgi:uncharacterized protein
MSPEVAQKIIEFVFQKNSKDQRLDIGFFGGEPLLELERIEQIVDLIKNHPQYSRSKVTLHLTSNGTIFNQKIAEFLLSNSINFCLSCDGPPQIHDIGRKYKNGQSSAARVEQTLKEALPYFPLMPVNAVYSEQTLQYLPQTVDYLIDLGVKNIYLNPNISANWTQTHAQQLDPIYGALAEKYIQFYLQGKPKFINLIDNKISVILRGGYKPLERCQMGSSELAFGTTGNLYPCERLIGSDNGKTHCLGNILDGTLKPTACKTLPSTATNTECTQCGLSEYCMNWCGCTNYHATGRYDHVSAFMCAHERATINVAYQTIQKLNQNNITLSHHIQGTPLTNVATEPNQQPNHS